MKRDGLDGWCSHCVIHDASPINTWSLDNHWFHPIIEMLHWFSSLQLSHKCWAVSFIFPWHHSSSFCAHHEMQHYHDLCLQTAHIFSEMMHRCQLLRFRRSSYDFRPCAMLLRSGLHVLRFSKKIMFFHKFCSKIAISGISSLISSTFVYLSCTKLLLNFDFTYT